MEKYDNKLLAEARKEINNLSKSLNYYKGKIKENEDKLAHISEIIVRFNALDFTSENAFFQMKKLTKLFFEETFYDNFSRRKYFEKKIKQLNN